MVRVKRGTTINKKHGKVRSYTKGMQRSHRSSVKRGKQAVTRSLVNSYNDRRNKKRTLRALWNARINAGARMHGTTYSRLINGLKKANVNLDRKILSELAVNEPKSFEAVVKSAKLK